MMHFLRIQKSIARNSQLCSLSYKLNINLSLRMSDERLLVYCDRQYVEAFSEPTVVSDAETIIVPDASQLMAVLGVKDKEDVIDSLMEQCASVVSPLDFDELLSFLQANNLAYTRKP